MKLTTLKQNSRVAAFAALFIALVMTSCAPSVSNGDGEKENPGETVLDDPEGTQAIVLYKGNGDNIAGLYYSSDGLLTSSNGWHICPIGTVSCLARITSIPREGWGEVATAALKDGFVAYHPQQGFMRMFIGATASNDYGQIEGIGVKFASNFYGVEDEDLEVSKTEVKIPAEGGSVKIDIKNKSYIVFQASSNARWCKVAQTPSKQFSYIIDGVEISADANTDGEDRTTTVMLSTHGNKRVYINVTQAAE